MYIICAQTKDDPELVDNYFVTSDISHQLKSRPILDIIVKKRGKNVALLQVPLAETQHIRLHP